jgi:hypothetical protein
LNPLQRWRLVKYCEAHELDTHLIDDEISYSENMAYLRTLVPEERDADKRMDEWEAKIAQQLTEHILDEVVMDLRAGKGPRPGEAPKAYEFSLKEFSQTLFWVKCLPNAGQTISGRGILNLRGSMGTTGLLDSEEVTAYFCNRCGYVGFYSGKR